MFVYLFRNVCIFLRFICFQEFSYLALRKPLLIVPCKNVQETFKNNFVKNKWSVYCIFYSVYQKRVLGYLVF